MTVLKARVTAILAVTAVVPFLWMMNQSVNFESNKKFSTQAGNYSTIVFDGRSQLESISHLSSNLLQKKYFDDQRSYFGQPSEYDHSKLFNTSFRFKEKELPKLDESYQYRAPQQLLNDYDAWALAVKQQYPDIPERLKVYRAALETSPNHRQLQADYVTLLSWNQEHQAALEFWGKHLFTAKLPVYVLNTLGLSAREVGNYELSRTLYEKSLRQDPAHVQTLLGLAALDTRQKNFAQSEARLLKVLAKQPGNEEALNLLVYSYNQEGKPELERSVAYGSLIKRAAGTPNEPRLHKLQTLSLLNLGAVDHAASRMEKNPQYFQEADWLNLSSVQSTQAIRRVIGSARGLESEAYIKQAFDLNQAYIDKLKAIQPEPTQKLSSAYADRIVLLNNLARYDNAITVLDSEEPALLEQLPAYGRIALADSYQGAGQPKTSLAIIQDGFKNQRIELNNRDALKVGYYAALDTGRIDLAEQYMKRLTDGQTPWRYSQNNSRRKFNPNYGDAALMQALHKGFVNDLAGAEQGLRELLKLAPQNNEYRQNLADVLRWRGFVDESDKQLDIIHSTDPDFKASRISRVYNRLAHRQFEQARVSLDDIKQGGTNNRSKRLIEDYAIAVDPSLEISLSGGNSSGSNFSSQDRNYGMRINSRLYDDHWRAFATVQNYRSSFFQQNEATATQGIGVSYLNHWFSAELELYDAGHFDGVEIGGRFNWYLNDHVSFDLSHYTFNKNTPVRAVYSGVDSDLSTISVNYYHDERQQYSASLSQSSFSDGNKRDTASLSGSQVLYYDYNQRLTLSESLYSEQNSLDSNRMYFNPDSAFGASLGLTYEEMLYRNARASLWHGLRLEYGLYNQKGFDGGDIGGISYFHQWQFSRRSSLNYSIGYNRRLYDGLTETGPVFSLSYGVTF